MIKETEVLTDLFNAKSKVNILALYDKHSDLWGEVNKDIENIVTKIKNVFYGEGKIINE